ncbi:MAG: nicotinamide mononucleotide transporter, partial [Parvicellaceae bacterium]
MNIDLLFVLELIAVVSGIVSVWLAKKESVLLYPIGSLSVIIWFYLCYNSNL